MTFDEYLEDDKIKELRKKMYSNINPVSIFSNGIFFLHESHRLH